MTLKLEVGKSYKNATQESIYTVLTRDGDIFLVKKREGNSDYYYAYSESGVYVHGILGVPKELKHYNLVKEYKEPNYKYFGMYSKYPHRGEYAKYEDDISFFDRVRYCHEVDNVLIGVYKIDR